MRGRGCVLIRVGSARRFEVHASAVPAGCCASAWLCVCAMPSQPMPGQRASDAQSTRLIVRSIDRPASGCRPSFESSMHQAPGFQPSLTTHVPFQHQHVTGPENQANRLRWRRPRSSRSSTTCGSRVRACGAYAVRADSIRSLRSRSILLASPHPTSSGPCP